MMPSRQRTASGGHSLRSGSRRMESLYPQHHSCICHAPGSRQRGWFYLGRDSLHPPNFVATLQSVRALRKFPRAELKASDPAQPKYCLSLTNTQELVEDLQEALKGTAGGENETLLYNLAVKQSRRWAMGWLLPRWRRSARGTAEVEDFAAASKSKGATV